MGWEREKHTQVRVHTHTQAHASSRKEIWVRWSRAVSAPTCDLISCHITRSHRKCHLTTWATQQRLAPRLSGVLSRQGSNKQRGGGPAVWCGPSKKRQQFSGGVKEKESSLTNLPAPPVQKRSAELRGNRAQPIRNVPSLETKKQFSTSYETSRDLWLCSFKIGLSEKSGQESRLSDLKTCDLRWVLVRRAGQTRTERDVMFCCSGQ